jgi:hypothetical protein
MSSLFRTKDTHLAALLRCELGREAQVDIVFDAAGTAFFQFDHHPQCIAIKREFYADKPDADFTRGYMVNDARAPLMEASAVRKELAIARDNWRAAQKENHEQC